MQNGYIYLSLPSVPPQLAYRTQNQNIIFNEWKTTKDILTHFWHSPEYEEQKNNGYTEAELWQIFMDAAKSYQIYPLYRDIQGDGKYKLLDMKGYMYIMEKRMRSIASEVTRKAKEFIAIGEIFPTIKDEFMDHYHQRGNAESTFASIKKKFGETIKSKDRVAQMNELLCKIIAYNITVLIQAMFELGITPDFAVPRNGSTDNITI